jgi:hypothetical protein
MPSQLHEALLLLFRNRPTLAPELMRDALHCDLPAFTEARIDSADLTDVKPAEYRADLVVLLLDGVPVYGIIVEVQLSRDASKRFVWPAYATSLRARLEVPVSLLVVTADDAIARWAAQPIALGNGGVFRPLVLSPSGVPEIIDEERARADPELAVLCAMAHGRDKDVRKSVRNALMAELACGGLDEKRWGMYLDLVFDSLSEAARKELRAMNPAKYEYRSEFAKRYFGQGLAEGRAEGELHGRAALLQRLLTRRFGPLPAEATDRLSAATIDELDAIGERLLSAQSLDEALG